MVSTYSKILDEDVSEGLLSALPVFTFVCRWVLNWLGVTKEVLEKIQRFLPTIEPGLFISRH